jgi:hypothetical protein
MHQPTGMGYSYRPIDSGALEVAQVWEDDDDAEMAANVHLVAAAPDMLAALKLCVELETNCDGRVICFCDDPEIAKHGKCYMCVACDAIAKAEGRTDD